MSRRRKSKLPFFLITSGLVVGWAALHYYRVHHAERLGAGTPLDQTHSQIKVLSPSNDTPTSLPTATSSTAIIGEPRGATRSSMATEPQADAPPIILTSATVITTPTPLAPPPSLDIQGIKLGITLTLLANEYASGGVAALATLESATKLATNGGNAALVDKLSMLRKTTPANGPITPALLLVEAQRVNAIGAPDDADDQPDMPTHWLHNLIKIRSVDTKPETAQTSWPSSMQSVLLQLAANNPAGASALLNAQPLQADDRLDDLRTALAGYLDQTNSLNAVLAAYASQTP